MIDYKQRQASREVDEDDPRTKGIVGDSRKPYHHEERPPEDPAKVAQIINDFYKNKEQYEAFVRLVGRDTAMLWMANLLQKVNKK